MTNPLISVIIPTYNQAEFLSRSIQSVQAQTYPNVEIIVVNDGSTDATGDILKLFNKGEPHIRMLNQVNQGLSAARNAGIQIAEGAYIALLDSDDVMDPKRLEEQLLAMQSDPFIDILYTSVRLIDEKGNNLKTVRRDLIDPSNFLAVEFFRNQVPSPSTILCKRKVFEKEPFNKLFRAGEDLEWILRAAHLFRFAYLDQPLTSYRRHRGNISEKLKNLREIEFEILHHYGKKHIKKCVEKSRLKDKDLWYGKILFIMDEYTEALKILNCINHPLANFYLGNCYYELGDIDEAIKAYRKSIAIDQRNPACYNNLGVCLLKMNKKNESERYFSIAKRLNAEYLDPQNKRFTRRELRKDLLPYKSF